MNDDSKRTAWDYFLFGGALLMAIGFFAAPRVVRQIFGDNSWLFIVVLIPVGLVRVMHRVRWFKRTFGIDKTSADAETEELSCSTPESGSTPPVVTP